MGGELAVSLPPTTGNGTFEKLLCLLGCGGMLSNTSRDASKVYVFAELAVLLHLHLIHWECIRMCGNSASPRTAVLCSGCVLLHQGSHKRTQCEKLVRLQFWRKNTRQRLVGKVEYSVFICFWFSASFVATQVCV